MDSKKVQNQILSQLQKRDAIWSAITGATEVFLRGSLFTWQENVLQVISNLGNTLEASRIYLCKNTTVTAEVAITGVRYQWVREGNKTEIDIPELQEVSLQTAGFSRWADVLYHGHLISGWISDLPLSERGWFMGEHAETLIVAPVFVENTWWGFLGIEDYANKASFSQAEIEAFKTLSVIFGAAIRRKRTEEELEREKASVIQQAKAVEDIARFPAEDPSPILRVSGHGVVLYVNDAAQQLLVSWGVKIGESLPQDWQQVTLEILRSSQSQAHDVKVGTKIYSLLFVPVGGNYVNIYGREVTRERNADEMKSQFISMASHQLRTPLTSLRWYSERLLKKTEGLTEKQQESIKVLHMSSVHMARVVDDLLNVSRIEADKFTPDLQDVNVVEIVKENFAELSGQAEEKQVKLILNASDSEIFRCDPNLLRQIHINLLSNAIKYTPNNGNVTTDVYLEPEKLIITVKDTGIGIPEAEQGKIFERFYRASNARELYEQGTGLGLSVAKMLVERCGGTIGFNSHFQQGSEFFFTLPLKKESNG